MSIDDTLVIYESDYTSDETPDDLSLLDDMQYNVDDATIVSSVYPNISPYSTKSIHSKIHTDDFKPKSHKQNRPGLSVVPNQHATQHLPKRNKHKNNKLSSAHIPRIVLQFDDVYINHVTSGNMNNEVRDMMPRWSHTTIDLEGGKRFIYNNFRRYYNYFISLDNTVQQKYIIIYLWLWKYGGVYIDSKFTMMSPLDDIISSNNDLYVTNDIDYNDCYSVELIITKAEHPLWMDMLRHIMNGGNVKGINSLNCKLSNKLYVSELVGSHLFTSVLYKSEYIYTVIPGKIMLYKPAYNNGDMCILHDRTVTYNTTTRINNIMSNVLYYCPYLTIIILMILIILIVYLVVVLITYIIKPPKTYVTIYADPTCHR